MSVELPPITNPLPEVADFLRECMDAINRGEILDDTHIRMAVQYGRRAVEELTQLRGEEGPEEDLLETFVVSSPSRTIVRDWPRQA